MLPYLPASRPLSDEQLGRIRARLGGEIPGPSPGSRRVSHRASVSRRTAVTLILVSALTGALISSGSVLGALGLKEDPSPWVQLENEWRNALEAGARTNPDAKFANLEPTELLERLEAAARDGDFAVVSVTLLKPRGLAPLIVVRARDESDFAARVPLLVASVDPKVPTRDDRSGWAFEGFFLKAIDADGQPFLVIHNHWRDDGPGGAQWARDRDLLPFKTLANRVG